MDTAQKLAERAAKVKAAMARAQAYMKAKKSAEVHAALADKDISPAAFRLWRKKPEKLITAYKCNDFLQAISTLPDLEAEKRNDAYTFALAELGVGRETQKELAGYQGVYEIFHDFSGFELHHLAFSIEEQPFLAMFAFRYSNHQRPRGFCDGLMVTRNGRMILAGFSRTTIFQAAFRCAAYPSKDVIKGIGLIEDFESGNVQISKLALVRRTSTTDRQSALRFVQDSRQEA